VNPGTAENKSPKSREKKKHTQKEKINRTFIQQ
jgi:hypothetical protein